MKRKIIISLLTLALLLSLAACKSSEKSEGAVNNASVQETESNAASVQETGNSPDESQESSTQDVDIVENSEENGENFVETDKTGPSYQQESPESVTSQLALIAENFDMWVLDNEIYQNSECQYAITDLDGNGRLEVISSSMAGTGLYTYSSYYEVNSAFDGLEECVYDKMEGDSEPDIMCLFTTAYYDAATNIYHYIFEDVVRIGAMENYVIKSGLTLTDGTVSYTPLVTAHSIADGDEMQSFFYDDQDCEISGEDFENLDYLFGGCEKYTVNFGFTEIDGEDDILSTITASYSGFYFESEN